MKISTLILSLNKICVKVSLQSRIKPQGKNGGLPKYWAATGFG